MTTASLILGVASICIGLLGQALSPIGFVCGVLGIVLGAVSIKRDYMLTGTAKAGFITSIVGTVFSIAMFILVYFVNIDLSAFNSFIAGNFL